MEPQNYHDESLVDVEIESTPEKIVSAVGYVQDAMTGLQKINEKRITELQAKQLKGELTDVEIEELARRRSVVEILIRASGVANIAVQSAEAGDMGPAEEFLKGGILDANPNTEAKEEIKNLVLEEMQRGIEAVAATSKQVESGVWAAAYEHALNTLIEKAKVSGSDEERRLNLVKEKVQNVDMTDEEQYQIVEDLLAESANIYFIKLRDAGVPSTFLMILNRRRESLDQSMELLSLGVVTTYEYVALAALTLLQSPEGDPTTTLDYAYRVGITLKKVTVNSIIDRLRNM